MNRVLFLRLAASDAAEARLNGIVVARLQAGGGTISVAVHEYLADGRNDLMLVVVPTTPGGLPVPRQATAPMFANLKLLLTRLGHVADTSSARCLAELAWSLGPNEVFAPSIVRRSTLSLPVRFPRWRWMDLAPMPMEGEHQVTVTRFLMSLAVSLAKGDAEAFVDAARPRFEDRALAYGWPLPDMIDAWRAHVAALHASGRLRPRFALLGDVMLMPAAEGRLFECLSRSGEPALCTEPAPDGSRLAWPLHVAMVDERCVIVR